MSLRINWYYHRTNCRTCDRADSLLADLDAKVDEQVEARKVKFSAAEAVRLARSSKELWVAKGTKVVHLDLKRDKPSDAELKRLLIGPSGTLRAPVIRRGHSLFVGFNGDVFRRELAT